MSRALGTAHWAGKPAARAYAVSSCEGAVDGHHIVRSAQEIGMWRKHGSGYKAGVLGKASAVGSADSVADSAIAAVAAVAVYA